MTELARIVKVLEVFNLVFKAGFCETTNFATRKKA